MHLSRVKRPLPLYGGLTMKDKLIKAFQDRIVDTAFRVAPTIFCLALAILLFLGLIAGCNALSQGL